MTNGGNKGAYEHRVPRVDDPRTVHLVGAGGKLVDIKAAEVAIGSVVRVFPGEAVPVDGVIASGFTSIDESLVTGEPLPKDKAPGDAASAGTGNCNGSVDVKATRAGDNKTIARMAHLAQSAAPTRTQAACRGRTSRRAPTWASSLRSTWNLRTIC